MALYDQKENTLEKVFQKEGNLLETLKEIMKDSLRPRFLV